MYKLPNPQISFRLNSDEYELLNSLSENFQEESQKDFTNAKQFVMAMLANVNELENKIVDFETKLKALESIPKTTVNNEMLELEPLFITAKELLGYEDELDPVTNTTILQDLIEVIQIPPAPAVEIEIPVIKEVPIELTENEVIVKMTEGQRRAIDFIAEYRERRHLDAEKLDAATIIRRMTFNKGSLTNWHDEFETGINSVRTAKTFDK